MSKISATKKIAIEELPSSVRSWVVRLIEPINRFFEQTYFALAKGLTVSDNLKAQKFSLDIAANQTFPMSVTWNLNERPTMLVLAHIAESKDAVIGNHAMQWAFNNGTIEITISGLDSSKKYTATVVGLV